MQTINPGSNVDEKMNELFVDGAGNKSRNSWRGSGDVVDRIRVSALNPQPNKSPQSNRVKSFWNSPPSCCGKANVSVETPTPTPKSVFDVKSNI